MKLLSASIILAFLAAVAIDIGLISEANAQGAPRRRTVRPTEAATLPAALAISPAMMMHQENLREQLQEASDSRAQYERYRDQVTSYIHQVEEICAEAHLQKQDVEARLQSAQKLANKGDDSARAEVTNLRNWLDAEANLSTQAAHNVEVCHRWLAHFKDRSNIDSYNAGREEQAIADERKKLENAQAALASEARKARDRDYWLARDEYLDNDYDGNTAVFGRNRGARIYRSRSRGGSRVGSGGSRSTSRVTSRIGRR